jgi:hypothetical protein
LSEAASRSHSDASTRHYRLHYEGAHQVYHQQVPQVHATVVRRLVTQKLLVFVGISGGNAERNQLQSVALTWIHTDGVACSVAHLETMCDCDSDSDALPDLVHETD